MFSNYTPTELLKLVNDTNAEHSRVKNDILLLADNLDEIQTQINNKINELNDIENLYKLLAEEMNKR
jgi:hypothetical protein